LTAKTGHHILWISDVHQYDVSLSNLMVYRTLSGLMMSVINDWDLSSPENGSGSHERTGMIPFMAMDLLTKKAIKGKAEHMYQYITESFFWVQIFCLQYEDGNLLGKDRPLDYWLTADAHSCWVMKHDSLKLAMENRTEVSLPPKHFLELDLFLLMFIVLLYMKDCNFSVLERQCFFWTWFMAQLPLSIHPLVKVLA
jgi:hypothetical protein